MSIFLSPSAIFLRLDFTPIFTQHDEHSQPVIIMTHTFTIRLTVLIMLWKDRVMSTIVILSWPGCCLCLVEIVDITLDRCKIWAQKNGAGAQKNAHIFKSNAPTWLKLGVGLDHMYTKVWNLLDPSVSCPHGVRRLQKVSSSKVT